MSPKEIVHLLRRGWINYHHKDFAIIPKSTLEKAAETIEDLEGMIDSDYKDYAKTPAEELSPSGIQLRNRILGWTPCSESEPELGKQYLVTDGSGYMAVGVYTEFGWMFVQYYGTPIAWSQLPAPYTEEDNELLPGNKTRENPEKESHRKEGE